MIDWGYVAGHALWIFGAAVLLARFSYRRYEAAEARGRGLMPLRSPGPDRFYRFGLLLLSVGLGVSSTSWFQRAIWGGLAVASVAEVIVARRRSTKPAHGERPA
jgi:hypothetical protein